MQPFKCPNCEGSGKQAKSKKKDCISCEGKGIVWPYEHTPQPYLPWVTDPPYWPYRDRTYYHRPYYYPELPPHDSGLPHWPKPYEITWGGDTTGGMTCESNTQECSC